MEKAKQDRPDPPIQLHEGGPEEYQVIPLGEAQAPFTFDGYVTFENGLAVDGPRQKAKITIDHAASTITVTMERPAMVFVAPGYPIIIESPDLRPIKEESGPIKEESKTG